MLTGLISDILQDRDVEVMSLDASIGKGHGVADLARVLCRLASIGYPLALTGWEKPSSAPRKPRMNVLLSGTNYRDQKTKTRSLKAESRGLETAGRDRESGEIGYKMEAINQLNQQTHLNNFPATKSQDKLPASDTTLQPRQLQLSKPTHDNKNIMPKNDIDQSEIIQDALKVVSQGLQSMQNLQSETARAHQKFLECQAEANRTLQEMMKNTQRLTESSLGIPMEPLQQSSIPRYRSEPALDLQQQELQQQENFNSAGDIDDFVAPTSTERSLDIPGKWSPPLSDSNCTKGRPTGIHRIQP